MEFRFKLALQLGMCVSELSNRMTAAEESAWVAYYRTNPFGDERADMRSAQISQLLFNTNAKKQDRKKLTDFMPFHRKQIKEQPDVSNNIRQFFSKFKKD